MSYTAIFTGWDNVTIGDLLVAYRKAKADCFFERVFPNASIFADYEQDLLGNLEKLLRQIKEAQGAFNIAEYLGQYRLIPKKLAIKPKTPSSNSHVHFSKPERAFQHLIDNNELTPEFRVIGDFPVNTYVLSALWINTIGHKFDACLNQCCYGSRLKRIRDDTVLDKNAPKQFHITAIGSFVPYFQPYQQWRNDGLNAIRDELEKDHEVIAVSLDLKSYYHMIDPTVIASTDLHQELELELSADERTFTEQLANFLSAWSQGASKFAQEITQNSSSDVSGGLVIGLTVSRIISNVLLHRWDCLIKEKLTPIHYGRYVDDMFLVLRDSGEIKNSKDLMAFLQERLGDKHFDKHLKESSSTESPNESDVWKINLSSKWQGSTRIQLQEDKQKLFILEGQAGLDLLNSIEKDIQDLSSEHRLMPSPDQLDDSTAARVLSAAGSAGESADTLRRADGLTIRRLSWSLQLHHVETLAHDLPANEWKEQREEFYQFAHNHILRPDNLFAHFGCLSRLLGFAIRMNEWQQAEQIVQNAYQSLEKIKNITLKEPEAKIKINGSTTLNNEELWRSLNDTLTLLFIDAATRYYSPDKFLSEKATFKEKRLSEMFTNSLLMRAKNITELMNAIILDPSDLRKKSCLVAVSDLAIIPYKKILKNKNIEKILQSNSQKSSAIFEIFSEINFLDKYVFDIFLKSSQKRRFGENQPPSVESESLLPYLFPTRPFTPAEISELAPECVGLPSLDSQTLSKNPSVIWAKYTQAIRGVWIRPTLIAQQLDEKTTNSNDGKKFLKIGTDRKDKIVVALTNFKTADADYAAMACGKPKLSRERYKRISDVVNYTLKLNPRPDYLLFPELSIPIEWIESIASRLLSARISLIAGTEYRHEKDEKDEKEILFSEACLALTDNRLGYDASVRIWQPKLEPAADEEKNLIHLYGKRWKSFTKIDKPIYKHHGVNFGVMICSELQNSKARVLFQGNIDALMVLSWNRDLETFCSLIESAALDIHAYMILVNNRTYGDSRIRSPAKESFMRDIARVRGGDNDFVVSATLDIKKLRAFQSRAKRWTQDQDKFKPVPECFELSPDRKVQPPE